MAAHVGGSKRARTALGVTPSLKVARARVREAARAVGGAFVHVSGAMTNYANAVWWFVRNPKDLPTFARMLGAEIRLAVRRRPGRAVGPGGRRVVTPARAAPVFSAAVTTPRSFGWAPETDPDAMAALLTQLLDPRGPRLPDLPALPAGAGLRMGDLWLEGDSLILRLEAEEGVPREDCVLRIRQLDLETRAAATLGAWPVGGDEACAFVAAPLLDGFAPLLITLSAPDGQPVDTALLAYPSLARGGAHYPELCAMASDAPYPASLARESRRFADRMWGETRPASPHLRRVRIDLRDATGAERIFAAGARRWLGALMGCALVADRPEGMSETIWLHFRDLCGAGSSFPWRVGAVGEIVLSPDALPTLAALTGTAGPDGGPAMCGVILTAAGLDGVERVDTFCAHPQIAALQPAGRRPALPILRPAPPPTAAPQAIRYTHPVLPEPEQILFPLSPDLPGTLRCAPPQVPVAVLFDSLGDPDRDVRALEALRRQRNVGPLEVFARRVAPRPSGDDPLSSVLETLFPDAWRILSAPAGSAAGLARFARSATAPMVLFLSGAVMLHDLRTLATLCAVAATGGAGSAGCALVRVEINPKRVSYGDLVLPLAQPAWPEKGPKPPDRLRRLGPATLPAPGNDARLALLPTAALVEAAPLDASVDTLQDAMALYCAQARARGLTHFVTTATTASLVQDDGASSAWPAEVTHFTDVAA
jgi:hypothetical protein